MRCLNWIYSTLAGFALMSSISFGAEVSVDQFSKNLLFSGRWEHGKTYSRTSAPAAMVQFKATAKSLEFELEGEARFRVDEDGKEIAIFTTNSRNLYKVKTTSSAGSHTYRLIKISESNPGGIHLYKITTDKSGKFDEPPKPSNRRIEFIGDSFTVGFGNEGQNGQDESLVFEKTNASKSYAFLIADGFKADFQVNAFSGRGLVRNYDNIVPEWPIPRLYDFAAQVLIGQDKEKVLSIIEELSGRMKECICHLDLHFLNIMLLHDGSGYRIIDWMNARIAPAVFDYARTFVILDEFSKAALEAYKQVVLPDLWASGVSKDDFSYAIKACTILRQREKTLG
jgi:hypothetical protein